MTGNVVHVTQQFIDEGQRYETDTCPIALALADWSNHLWIVQKHSATMSPFDSTGGDKWRLDDAVKKWIAAFDNGDPVCPIELVVDSESLTPTIRLLELTEGKND